MEIEKTMVTIRKSFAHSAPFPLLILDKKREMTKAQKITRTMNTILQRYLF
ncbi:hypothetical protein [Chryseobacterium shandongense]|uniref:hypothetical protein n=1 Tax=Chryseobacterium shandongense TaxID=1493872 RepID=UPI0013DDAA95|nr:hypothetical protein [Chryseobacterium shandongense]